MEMRGQDPGRPQHVQELNQGLALPATLVQPSAANGRVHRKAVPWIFHQPVWGHDQNAVKTVGLVRPPRKRHAPPQAVTDEGTVELEPFVLEDLIDGCVPQFGVKWPVVA